MRQQLTLHPRQETEGNDAGGPSVSPFIKVWVLVFFFFHILLNRIRGYTPGHVEIREQVVGGGSLVPPCRSWESNSDLQTRQQDPLPRRILSPLHVPLCLQDRTPAPQSGSTDIRGVSSLLSSSSLETPSHTARGTPLR